MSAPTWYDILLRDTDTIYPLLLNHAIAVMAIEELYEDSGNSWKRAERQEP